MGKTNPGLKAIAAKRKATAKKAKPAKKAKKVTKKK
jgi:hypothetical protein